MSDQLWGLVFLLIVIGAIIVIVGQILGMRGEHAANQAEVARDQAYRNLAEDLSAAQRTALAEQQKIASELADLRTRLGSIETMMREVG